MFRTEKLTTLQCAAVSLAVLAIALSGCGPTPPPTPTATSSPPAVALVVNPDITDVFVGQTVALIAETSGKDLRFKWSAGRGKLSTFNESAVFYTAPDSAGVDTVTVEVSSSSGTTIEHVSFNIIIPDTPTLTATTTNTPTPTPTPPPNAVVVANVNLRSGPGTVYKIIDTLSPGQVLTVTGRIADTAWLQVSTDQMREGWVINLADLVTLNLPTEQIPFVSPPPTPASPPASFTGKICQIKSGQDTSTIFLRQAEFDALGLPIGTKVVVTLRDTGRTVENVTLGLDSGLAMCSVRLAESLREALGVAYDTDIVLESRPDHQFDITLLSLPTACLITEPANGDENLSYEDEVRATCSNVPDSLYVWILVYSHHDYRYYPQPGPIGSGSGDYVGKAYLGTPTEGIGDRFDIIVALANETVSVKLRQDAESYSGYEFALPDGVEEKARITVRHGSTLVALITFHGRYVTAMGADRDWVIRAETTKLKDWEKLTLLCLDNGKVALKTHHDRYVTAMGADRDWVLRAETAELKDWEKFTLVEADTGEQLPCLEAFKLFGQDSVRIAFKTHHDRYVTAMDDQPGWDWELRAETRTLSDWEKFELVLLPE